MAIKNTAQLKRKFQKGMYPTETDFADLIDSLRHKQDMISLTDVSGLTEALNKKINSSEVKTLEKTVKEHDASIERMRLIQNDQAEKIYTLNEFRTNDNHEADINIEPDRLDGFVWDSDRWINHPFDIAEMQYILESMVSLRRDALVVSVLLRSGETHIARFPAVFTRERADEESFWHMEGHAVFAHVGKVWNMHITSLPEDNKLEIEFTMLGAGSPSLNITLGDDFPAHDEFRISNTYINATADADAVDAVGKVAYMAAGHMCAISVGVILAETLSLVFPATAWCEDGKNIFVSGTFSDLANIYFMVLSKSVGKEDISIEITCVSSRITLHDLANRVGALEKTYSSKLRLMKLGYTNHDIYRALSAEPSMSEERLQLREDLATIGYTPLEIENCMEDVTDLSPDNIVHARRIMDSWDPTATAVKITSANGWANDANLVVFPKLDFSNVISMSNAWNNCPNLAFMPDLDTSSCTSFGYLYFNGNDYGVVPQNRMKRVPDWNLENATSIQDVYPVNLREMIFPSVIRTPKATRLRLFVGMANSTLPTVIYDNTKVTAFDSMYMYSEINNMPIQHFEDIVTAIGSIYNRCNGLTDLSGSCIVARNAAASQLFQKSQNITHLPFSIILGPTDMRYGFQSMRLIEEVPDYSNIKIKNFDSAFSCSSDDIYVNDYTYSKLRKVLGIDFSEVTDTSFCFGCENKYGSNVTRPTTYVRIKNLGKGPATTIDLRCLGNWGADDEGYRSLIETIVTGSYDRKSNGMPTATIRLPQSVADRLGTENIALVTSKGYTISTTTV